jgi:hypothetical protein
MAISRSVLFGFVTALILLGIVDVKGQRTIVGKTELEVALKKEREFRGNQPYQIETVTESYANGNVERWTLRVYEYSSGRVRELLRVEEGGLAKETEEIVIGGLAYTRSDGSNWEKRNIQNSFVTVGALFPIIQTLSENCEQISFESVILDHEPVDLYEILSISKSEEGLSMTERLYWFRRDTAILRIEEVKGLFAPRIIKQRKVAVYRYDQTIKIEAPIP